MDFSARKTICSTCTSTINSYKKARDSCVADKDGYEKKIAEVDARKDPGYEISQLLTKNDKEICENVQVQKILRDEESELTAKIEQMCAKEAHEERKRKRLDAVSQHKRLREEAK